MRKCSALRRVARPLRQLKQRGGRPALAHLLHRSLLARSWTKVVGGWLIAARSTSLGVLQRSHWLAPTAPRAPLPTGELKSRTSAVWMPRSLARSQWRRRVDVRWCVRRRRRAPAIRRPRRRPSACLRSTCPAERPWCGGDHADRRVDSSNFEDLTPGSRRSCRSSVWGAHGRGPETEPDHCPVDRQPTHRLPSLIRRQRPRGAAFVAAVRIFQCSEWRLLPAPRPPTGKAEGLDGQLIRLSFP